MNFGWLNAKIGWKTANGQLLFLALHCSSLIGLKTCMHANFLSLGLNTMNLE